MRPEILKTLSRRPGLTHRRAPSVPRAGVAGLDSDQAAVLDAFWQRRGVLDESIRMRMCDIATSSLPSNTPKVNPDFAAQLPGITTTWAGVAEDVKMQAIVKELSKRILRLNGLLGGEGVDVAWMVVREPRLLNSEPQSIAKRLVEMKVAAAGTGMDVIAMVQEQPALLLPEQAALDSTENLAARLSAWKAGLLSDSDKLWVQRFESLQDYTKTYGDAHVGFREGDDPELTRWAQKQRRDFKVGLLDEGKAEMLGKVGFLFIEEEAEWYRWFNELKLTKEATDEALPSPLTDLTSFYLTNWAAVQRVSRRCKRLSDERIRLLDSIGFDFDAPDALS